MKKSKAMLRNLLAKFMVLTMVLTLVGIVNPGASVSAAAKPAISKTTASILVGKKVDLNVKNWVKGAKATWKSSNKNIATVDKKGVVTGVKKGTVNITCKVETSKATYQLSSKVTVRVPATSVSVSNKVTAVNLGQVYSLKTALKPATSNDLVTWTSSNTKVLRVNSQGKIRGVAKGSATITGKTLSGKSVKALIKVVDKDGTVTTQKELDSLLGSGASVITLRTDAEAKFTVKAGQYTTQKLVVDAPKADVENNGVFKNVEIKAIKASTWTENAEGNQLVITAKDARIVVSEKAKVSIAVNNKETVLKIENNGKVESIVLDNAASIELSGTSKEQVKVEVNGAGAKLTSSLPLDITANAKVALDLKKGAENTKVAAANKDVVPTVTGDVKIVVTVGSGDSATTVEVVGEGASGGPTGGGSNGGGNPTPTPTTKETIKGIETSVNAYKFTLPVSYDKLKKVTVKYSGFSYEVNSSLLSVLNGFLSDPDLTYDKWVATTLTTKTYQGQTVKVTGYLNNPSNVVEFIGGALDGRKYHITLTEDETLSIENLSNGIHFGVNKNDTKSLTIIGSNSQLLTGLEFNIEY